jgi:two-component system response regulator RegX3
MRAVLRRAEARGEPATAPTPSKPLVVCGVSLDVERHQVVVRGDEVPMPLREFEVLTALMQNAGRVVTRDQLIDRVWGHDYVGDTKTLDVHIKRLRKKVEVDPKNPELIVTIRGLGYRFEDA